MENRFFAFGFGLELNCWERSHHKFINEYGGTCNSVILPHRIITILVEIQLAVTATAPATVPSAYCLFCEFGLLLFFFSVVSFDTHSYARQRDFFSLIFVESEIMKWHEWREWKERMNESTNQPQLILPHTHTHLILRT